MSSRDAKMADVTDSLLSSQLHEIFFHLDTFQHSLCRLAIQDKNHMESGPGGNKTEYPKHWNDKNVLRLYNTLEKI